MAPMSVADAAALAMMTEDVLAPEVIELALKKLFATGWPRLSRKAMRPRRYSLEFGSARPDADTLRPSWARLTRDRQRRHRLFEPRPYGYWATGAGSSRSTWA